MLERKGVSGIDFVAIVREAGAETGLSPRDRGRRRRSVCIKMVHLIPARFMQAFRKIIPTIRSGHMNQLRILRPVLGLALGLALAAALCGSVAQAEELTGTLKNIKETGA